MNLKTSRIFRIFMMALDTLVLFLIRPFRKFTKLFTYENESSGALNIPHAVDATRPEVLGIKPELEVDGVLTEHFSRPEPIHFDPQEPYSEHEGIVTFRGDHFRSTAAYGTAAMAQKKLEVKWSIDTGKLKKGYGSGFWTGSGWTGQPLIVRWKKEDKQRMNLPHELVEDDNLAEVIYSTMDGKVYFLNLATGERTREDIEVGLPFKGAGALHPTLPLLHLGPGDSGPDKETQYARAYLYSLTNQEKLLEYGGGPDPFAIRIFHGFDSSPLFDKKTDTLIEPSENGILYTMKLNSVFDENGNIKIDPSEVVKLRYSTARSSEQSYWLGMEDSAVVYQNFIYIADNGGNLLCIDLNTMEVVWAQDVVDDTNGSPVMAIEDGIPYIYIATSLHWTASRLFKLGDVPIFKINAITGEYVWKRTYLCNTVAGISGGVQATCVLGKGNIDDLVIFPVARTPQVRSGYLVALDKKTGKEVWKLKMRRYAWSSPVAVYDENYNASIAIGDCEGTLRLVDGRTGKVLDSIELGSNIEASPAVFNDTIVVGTRGQKIFAIDIK